MLVKNLTPFAVAAKPTSRNPPQAELTFIVRGKFRIVPDAAMKALEPAFEGDLVTQGSISADLYRDDDDERAGESIYPGDLADFKVTAEVMRAGGHCYPPGGREATSCDVAFSVGSWSKSLRVVGLRAWSDRRVGAVGSSPLPFKQMPIGYRHSFGGPGYEPNPAGKGMGDELPNVESPGEPIRSRDTRPVLPPGFGPINLRWPQRGGMIGKAWGEDYEKKRAPWYAEDFDWRYFQCAPPDQQLRGYLKGDERLRFQNLHPEWPVLTTTLPGLRIRVFVKDVSGVIREMTTQLDTLWATPDEDLVTLTWRGLLPVRDDDLADVTFVLVASEPLAEREAPGVYHQLLEEFAADPIGLQSLEAQALEAERDAGLAKVAAAQAALMELGANGEQGLGDDIGKVLKAAGSDAGTGAALGDLGKGLAARREQLPDSPDVAATLRAAIVGDAPRSTTPALKLPPAGGMPRVAMPELSARLATAKETLESAEKEAAAQYAAQGLDQEPPALVQHLRQVLDHPMLAGIEGKAPVEPAPYRDLSEQDYRGRDLSGADMRGANLDSALLSGANLSGAKLDGADLSHAVLEGADLRGASLTGATLSLTNLNEAQAAGANFERARLTRTLIEAADLSGASFRDTEGSFVLLRESRLQGAVFDSARWSECLFERDDLGEASFVKATLTSCAFLSCQLGKASFDQVLFTKVCFVEAEAAKASFRGARGDALNLSGSMLDGADMQRAILPRLHLIAASARHANLFGANLQGARLYRANLDHANLGSANLLAADLRKASLNRTSFRDANLFEAVLVQASGHKADFDGANLKRVRLPQ